MGKLKEMRWRSVGLEGLEGLGQGAGAGDYLQGFVGLEECTDYDLETGGRALKKKKQSKKRKSKPDAPAVQQPSLKKQKISNGFVVETCNKIKPSKDNSIPKPQRKVENNKNETNKNNIIINSLTSEANSEEHKDILEDMRAWSQFQIPEEILKALAEEGFVKPTKIQELCLPPAMLGRRDILGAAETGSGKTLAFGIPILAGIMKLKEKQLAGEDVYEMQYKKTSIKKNAHSNLVTKKKVRRKPKNKPKFVKEDAAEENTDDENTNDVSDNESINEDTLNDASDKESDDDEGIDTQESDPENDVSKASEILQGDDPGSDSSENYIHLSEMFDSEDFADSTDEEQDKTQESVDATEEDSEKEEEIVNEDNVGEGIGCVKVIDDVEMPAPFVTRTGKPLYALIVTPTRELAMQITKHLVAAAKYTGIRVAVIMGGMAQVKQERILALGPEIVVCTPGRLWELMQHNSHLQQVDNIKFLAIDETDRMVEANHFEELHPLLERINSDDRRRAARQNFVFSATLTMVHDLPSHLKGKKVTNRGKILNRKVQKMTPQQKTKKLITMLGMTDPKIIDITTKNQGTAETLTECRIMCALEQKDEYLYYVLRRHPGRTIVFCNSIGCVKRLAQLFGLLKCRPLPLHANMQQQKRLKNLERFRDDPHGVLIATDVAARGLDIPGVDHVIHYQVPRTAENYVHRSGRTARANKEGLTILMMEPGEAFLYSKLCRTLNKTEELSSFPVPSHLLLPMRECVHLARDLERMALASKRRAQETGWLDRVARECDMVIDEDFVPMMKKLDADTSTPTPKMLQQKKKQLELMLSKPIIPKGFSYKYPTLNDPQALKVKEEDALQTMKRVIETGISKKEKRTSKNAPLLKLQEQFQPKAKKEAKVANGVEKRKKKKKFYKRS